MSEMNQLGPEGGMGQKPSDLDSVHQERMLRWFRYEHLPRHLQVISAPFSDMADLLVTVIQPGPERTVAMRKLLESKDAAVRATVHPGG